MWFIGYEENSGDQPEEVAAKFNYFFDAHASSQQATLCDIRELYRHVPFHVEGPKADLFTNLYDYRFDRHAVQHGVWKNLIAFEHGYRNKKLPDLLAYQKKSFVLPSAHKQALIQLYPLPAHNHAWYYGWLDLPQFPFLKTRALYQEHVYHNRMNSILSNIKTYRPEVVLMYAMDNINMLKESVLGFFPGAKFKMVKAIKLQMPQYHHATLHETKLLITTQLPALRHNRIETGFDWEAFGRTLAKEL